jgi:hypothetical protein
MKRQLLTLLAIAIAIVASAQVKTIKETEKAQSKAEIFSEKSGSLIQKQFIDVGKLKSCKIQVAVFTDLISNQKTSAVRFEKEYKASYSSTSDDKIALLDGDELDALIKSFMLLTDKIYSTSPTDYTEINFNSRSGFAAGCFFSKGKWSPYMKLEKFDGNSYVFLELEDTQPLIDILIKAKTTLN